MRRILFVVSILVVVSIWILLPIPVRGKKGAFNTVSGLAYCAEHWACMHEIGHALDQRAGWISQSPEFYKAVQMYLIVELKKETVTELPVCILELALRGKDGTDPTKKELYAYLFQYADGNPDRIPEGLRDFYDWRLAREWISRLSDEQTLYVFR